MATTDEAERAALALLSVTPHVTKLIQDACEQLHPQSLTVPQFRLLGAVIAAPDKALADVARTLGVSAPSTSVMVARLEHAGLVKKVKSGRSVKLRATAKGRKAYSMCIDGLIGDISARLNALDEDKLHNVQDVLGELGTVLNDAEIGSP
ncbi:MAG: MarR family transcriptional regulator [Pseudomonadota bacterium]